MRVPRRRRLNRALHEIRRPLQALILLDGGAPDAPSPRASARRGLLELTTAALADLEREVNGGGAEAVMRPVSCREVLLATVERWRPLAEADGGEIRVFWDAGSGVVRADAGRLGRALDNLLANALEHGGPPVVLTGSRVAGRLRITICDRGSRRRARARGGDASRRAGRRGDPRHGHGLEIVSELAATHGGRFALRRDEDGAVAALELPLADAGAALAA